MRNDHAPARMNADTLCDDCAFPDTCAADDACTRARLARLNFEATAGDAPSAIIEPPTKAELAGALNAYGILIDPAASRDGFLRILGAPIRDDRNYIGIVKSVTEHAPGYFEIEAAPATAPDVQAALMAHVGILPTKEWLRSARDYCNEPVPSPAPRKQIRAAIAEIEKAQALIIPAFEAEDHLIGGCADEIARQIRTAANVLESLPEAVAHQFGLTIRGACSFCHTTIFTADPKATDAEGRDVCEAHA